MGRRVRVSVPLRGFPRAVLLAYSLPLLSMLLAGALAQSAWPGGDGAALLGCVAGLAAGILAARLLGRRAPLAPRLSLSPDA